MWPWEHLAVGYLLYSIGLRALGRAPPGEREAVLVVAATQFPDLVDKPLSWGLGWFPSGFAIAHSVFVAVPLGIGAIGLSRRNGTPHLGLAVVVGYWSHLVADVLNPLRTGDGPLFERVLWPVVDTVPYSTDYGIARGLVYLRDFFNALLSMNPIEIALFYIVLPAIAIVLWMVDGSPGTAVLKRVVVACRRDVW